MTGALSHALRTCDAFYRDLKWQQVVVRMQEGGVLFGSQALFLDTSRLWGGVKQAKNRLMIGRQRADYQSLHVNTLNGGQS